MVGSIRRRGAAPATIGGDCGARFAACTALGALQLVAFAKAGVGLVQRLVVADAQHPREAHRDAALLQTLQALLALAG